jgi:Mg2+ and Co2+ transporter CorA
MYDRSLKNCRSIHYNFDGAVVNLTDNARFHSDEQTAADAIDAATLLDKLANLEERLVVISKTVNEEIQLFIASISIRDSETMMADSKIMREDSKVMREDSQIMKQQAARTTLLTSLAVIYLPLQLITGIFGMNIQEITGDARPRWWAYLIALGVGGVLTFLVYLGVKWWQWRDSLRKKRDGEKEKED